LGIGLTPGAAKALDAAARPGNVTVPAVDDTAPLGSIQAKLRETPSVSDAAGSGTTQINNALSDAWGGAGPLTLRIPRGEWTGPGVVAPPNGAAITYQGHGLTLEGAGSGEAFATTPVGSRVIGSSAARPTLDLVSNEAARRGKGSVWISKIRFDGRQNANVPVIDAGILQGTNTLEKLVAFQSGAGDGLQADRLTTSSLSDSYFLQANWSSSFSGTRTGTGVKVRPDVDHGLANIHKVTSRGWRQGFDIGNDATTGGAGRALSYVVSSCEVSAAADGLKVRRLCEGLSSMNLYVEGVPGTAIDDGGKGSIHINPYVVGDFTTGADLKGDSAALFGGYFGCRATGATAVRSSTVYGSSLFGTNFIWGQNGVGSNVATGLHLPSQANPSVHAFVHFGGWTNGTPILDQSYSSDHGGARQANGSGVVGYVPRATSVANRIIPTLSRGAINLHVDGATLWEAAVSGGGTLALVGGASVQRLNFASARTINRITAPNLPDKTGVLIFTNGNVTFTDTGSGLYITGIAEDLVIPAGELAVVEYQVLPGGTAPVLITNVHRSRKTVFTVATLPSASAVGAGTRLFVTDATATTFASVAAGGGSNKAPVYSDGTNWLIG